MSKEKGAQVSFFQDFFHAGLYKRNQGRVARQVTFAAAAAIVGLGCWRLSETLFFSGYDTSMRFGIPGGLLLAGLWISYRIVNVPSFADFLIAVEGEMAKVSWPSRGELFRSSLVVIFTIFLLAIVLFSYDFLWNQLLGGLGVSG